MSAEILRCAAALMRERAEAATPGPWTQGSEQDGEVLADGTGYAGDYYPSADVLAFDGDGHCTLEIGAGRRQDAEHIASWHPAVALAVADWLDEVAERQEPTQPYRSRSHGWTGARPANAVARAYLGSES